MNPVSTTNAFRRLRERDAEMLILGSLPGSKSLEMQQYYAHPQNAFWKLVARIYDIEGHRCPTRNEWKY